MYRSNNSGLSEESFLMILPQNQYASELESSLRTPSLPDPNFGMRWRDKTRLENVKVKSFQSARSSKRKHHLSRTTESSLSIELEPISSTCTRNTEPPLSAVPSPPCIKKWPVDIVPELILSISSRQSSNQTQLSWEPRPNNSSAQRLDSQNSPPKREHQPLLTPLALLEPVDQLSSERDDETKSQKYLWERKLAT